MDNFNQYSQDIAKLHEYGYRAYEKAGNFRRVIQKGFDIVRLVPVGHNQLAGTWHALRAYQDEQRKKGVPIKATGDEYWKNLPSAPQYGIRFTSAFNRPLIILENEKSSPRTIGRFTNFRWREGYPKPVRLYNDHGDNRDGVPCDGRCDSMACNCISPSDPGYPKGGNNEN